MRWKAWNEIGWMEKMAIIKAATETIPTAVPAPETEQVPNWKSDDSVSGQMRENMNGGVSTPKEVIGHQRPS